jgi:hypothetical protein
LPRKITLQVVAAGVGGPLEADEGGEAARLVVGLRGLDRLGPRVAVGGGAGQREALGHLAQAEAADDVDRGLGALAAPDLVVPLAALRRGEQRRVAAHQLREEPHAVGMIGHHQEVERPRQPDRLAAVGDDLLAPGEAVGVARRQARAERTRVHRVAGVQVRVAEQRHRRIGAPRVGRVARLRGMRLLQLGRVGRAGIALPDREQRDQRGAG